MKFVKYRHCWAHGYDDWEYSENIGYNLDNPNDCEYVQGLMREWEWSDKYRGVDIEGVEMPPKEWLEARYKSVQNKVEYYTEMVKIYSKLIEKYPENKE
jgi:hypothetical protein